MAKTDTARLRAAWARLRDDPSGFCWACDGDGRHGRGCPVGVVEDALTPLLDELDRLRRVKKLAVAVVARQQYSPTAEWLALAAEIQEKADG